VKHGLDQLRVGIHNPVQLGDIGIPVVVRLEGTNVEEGRRILEEADFDFLVAHQMADAAEKVVAAAKGGA